MIESIPPISEPVEGMQASLSPVLLPSGVFVALQNVTPLVGGVQRALGKRLVSFLGGAVWTIHQMDDLVIIQRDTQIEILSLYQLIPTINELVTDNSLVPVLDNSGIEVLA